MNGINLNYRILLTEARKIQGSLSQLLGAEKKNYTVADLRRIANDIYLKTDDYIMELEKMEGGEK